MPRFSSFWAKSICAVLALSMFLIGALPSNSLAGIIGTDEILASGNRASDISTIQKALESKVVKQKLEDAGLSPEEALSRVERLSDDELHFFALNSRSLYPGSDGLGALISLLVITILIIIILKMTGPHPQWGPPFGSGGGKGPR